MRIVTLALMATSVAFAASPNLTADWKLDISKSDFGQFPAPSSMTQKVTHAEPKLTVEVKQTSERGDVNLTASYTTDGKESTNKGFGGSDMKSVVKWDGETLNIETKGTFGDTAFTMKDKWTLSADGKVLTILRHFSSGMGEMDQKMTFDRQ